MADYDQIMKALRNAHAAGDTAAATRLAAMAKAAKTAQAQPAPEPSQEQLPAGMEGFMTPPRADAPQTQPAQRETGLIEQTAIGTREGVASGLGFPVDAVAAAINGIPRTINAATGSQMGDWVQNPVGGSESINRVFDAVLPERVDPQTAGQRIARRTGQEVGASAAMAPAMLATPGVKAAQGAYLATEGASAVGSGLGAGVANEVAPDSVAAEIVGQVAGGLAGGAIGGRLARPSGPKAPSTNDLETQASALYAKGDARPGADPQSVAGFRSKLDGVLRSQNMLTPTGRNLADGNVKKFLDVMDDFQGHPMTPREMQAARKFLTDAAASADPSDRRIGTILLKEFDGWRNAAVPEYKMGDALYGRMKRAKDVDWRIEKAENRAASTGTGGNAVNAMRQNIRQILDNPAARRGYSAEEIKAMEAIVRGDATTNAMRLVGRLSPTSGAVPLMANIVGVGVDPMIGTAIMGTGAAAKGLAELRTQSQINALAEMIRNGAAMPGNALAGVRSTASNALAARAGITAAQQ